MERSTSPDRDRKWPHGEAKMAPYYDGETVLRQVRQHPLTKANARFIAAAPDMFEALERWFRCQSGVNAPHAAMHSRQPSAP